MSVGLYLCVDVVSRFISLEPIDTDLYIASF
nr:MAG TPA: hypothetical protein [Caudoviricetes sp.]DAQ69191.1 MAG TPA: hypothetical protein [Caudoviricetes sp.]DAW00202.1 MAG TPA: hypothetical protein [Caudoviricetes sp.]